LPKNFRNKVKRYLEYLIDYKKQYKIEEEDVLGMLSDNLRVQLTVHLNAKMLHNTASFHEYSDSFLSQLIFELGRDTFSIDDHLFEEGDDGERLYFITKGSILLVHKKTRSYIKELSENEFLGEYSFYSEKPRTVTARSKNFTEVLTLHRHKFSQLIDSFPEDDEVY